MRKIKVVLSGIFYPLAMLTYFWRALERREDVELFTVGPFTGTYIPWASGMHISAKYVRQPDLALPSQVSNKFPSALIKPYLPWKPDLWLQIDAGWHLGDRPEATMVAHVQTDPHVLKDHYRSIKALNDVNFCMQLSYMEVGERYLPYAFDPVAFYPENLPKEYDACLIGLHYEQRDELVRNLRGCGMKVYYSIGQVFDEYRDLYNKSRIALNWSSRLDLNARTFEAFGLSRPLVTNRIPDLSNFFVEGDHYLGFDTVSEAVRQARYLLDNPTKAEEMARSAHRKAAAAHTWDHRIQNIFEVCKLA